MPGGWKNTDTTRTSTPEHRQWRTAVLTRDDHRCQIDGPGCLRVATEADHIIEVADGGAPLSLANGQALCRICHARKTAAHANRRRWANRGEHPREQHPGLRGG